MRKTMEPTWNVVFAFVIYLFSISPISAFQAVSDPLINLESLDISSCYSVDGKSVSLVVAEISWSNLDESSNVSLQIGSTTKQLSLTYPVVDTEKNVVDNLPLSSPQVVSIQVEADGSEQLLNISVDGIEELKFDIPITLPAACNTPKCDDNGIGGMVYFDANQNGQNESEQGLEGIQVTLQSCDEPSIVFQVLTAGDGTYTFDGIDPSGAYQVVFNTDSKGDLYEVSTGDNNSTVRYLNGKSCNVDLALSRNDALTEEDTDIDIFVSCFVHGAPLAGTKDDTEALLKLPYEGGSATPIALSSEVGTLWGIAWESHTEKVYTSSVLRRHAGFGPLGHAGIYTYDDRVGVKSWLDLSFGGNIDFGDLTSNDNRGLSTSSREPAQDELAWYRVGKIGIGDIDVSSDGRYLYATNLAGQSIVQIEIDADNDPSTTPSIEDIKIYPTPQPCGNTGEARPWGLKYHDGALYVTITCDASVSQSASDMRGYVYRLDPADGSFSDPILEFPLTYPKGSQAVHIKEFRGCGIWNPWNDDYSTWCTHDGYYVSPQPLLSDIEFSNDGSMHLSIMDRTAYMLGNDDFLPDGSGYESAISAAGDVLKAQKIGDKYYLESAGSTVSSHGSSADNGEGPGGGEFYDDSYYTVDGELIHAELAFGALALHGGNDHLIYTAVDPVPYSDLIFSGGIRWQSTEDGSFDRAQILYKGTVRPFLGKSAGLGDLELAVRTKKSIEIGDFAWIDKNRNGIQDACDEPASNLRVCLLNESGATIGKAITDEKGQYTFSSKDIDGLNPFSKYFVVFGCEGETGQESIITDQGELMLTSVGTGHDQLDSDADIYDGYPTICLETRGYGNDYSFDAGFIENDPEPEVIPDPEPEPVAIVDVAGILIHDDSAEDQCYKYGEEAKFNFVISNQGTEHIDSNIVSLYLPKGLAFDPSVEGNSGWTLFPLGFIYAEVMDLAPGALDTLCVFLTVKPGTHSGDWLLQGEVSQIFDSNGNDISLSDIDSPLNFNPNDNVGGLFNSPADNFLEGDGTAVLVGTGASISDQDNADPEEIKVFDLALRKLMSPSSTKTDYKSGERVDYTIEIHNQGNRTVSNIAVLDYGHSALEFKSEINDHFDLINGEIVYIHEEDLLPNEIVDIPISFILKNEFDGNKEIVNKAEITFFTDVNGKDLSAKDADSTPDANPDNDQNIDDEIRALILDVDGNEQYVDDLDFTSSPLTVDCEDFLDEDDSDFAELPILDLKLTKVMIQTPEKYGDTAVYIITVTNEGAINAHNVIITDHLADGLENIPTLNRDWTVNEYGAITTLINNTLLPGENVELPFYARVKESESSKPLSYLNIAEITYVEGENGEDISSKDIDSTPDSDPYNDVSQNGANLSDVELLASLLDFEGEDDHDPAPLSINDLSLTKVVVNRKAYYDVGDDVEYSITIKNEGNTPVEQVAIADIAPKGMSISPLDYVGWLDDGTGKLVNVIQGPIQSGEEVSIPIVLRVDPSARNNSTLELVNSAEIIDATDIYAKSIKDFDSTPANLVLGSSASKEDDDDDASIVLLALTPTECSELVTRSMVNISMGNNCQTVILPQYIFTGSGTTMPAVSDITKYEYVDTSGAVVNDSIIPSYFLGQCIEVSVMVDGCTGTYKTTFCIEDKDPPNITCAPNDTISCLEASQRIFTGLVADCQGVDTLLLDEKVVEIDTGAFVQRITRYWQLRDALGNLSDTCTQDILVRRLDFANQLTLPRDTIISCSDVGGVNVVVPPGRAGQPLVEGMPLVDAKLCNTSAVFQDQILIDTKCKRVTMRMWIVNEWRAGKDTTIRVPQMITVVDTVPPVIQPIVDTIRVATTANVCEADVSMPVVSFTDACNQSSVRVDMYTPRGALIGQNGGAVTLPVDTNIVYYVVQDSCHNSVRDTVVVIVSDGTAPLTICQSTLEVTIPDSVNTVTVDATKFDINSTDACGGNISRLVRHMDSTALGDSVVFTCVHIDTTVMIVLQVSDESGNSNTCMIATTIRGNMPACVNVANVLTTDLPQDGTHEVGGIVFSDMGVGIPDVEVTTSNGEYSITDDFGNYVFDPLSSGTSMDISASLESDFGVGVSTFDVVKIQRHILGFEPFDNQFREIAADINNDGKINALDLVLLRKHILGYALMPDADSWRFVADEDREIPRSDYKITSLDRHMDVDFVGIKVGDVTGDAVDKLTTDSRSRNNDIITYEIIDIGGYKELSFKASRDIELSGIQVVLTYNDQMLQYGNLSGAALSIKDGHFNATEPGKIIISWDAEKDQSIKSGEALWRVLFQGKSGNEWNYDFAFGTVNSQYIQSELYEGDDTHSLTLERSISAEEEMSQISNDPNPWDGYTNLSFEIPKSGMVELELYDAQNRLVFNRTKIFQSGEQKWKITEKEITQGGVYFGKMTFEGKTRVFKMIKID